MILKNRKNEKNVLYIDEIDKYKHYHVFILSLDDNGNYKDLYNVRKSETYIDKSDKIKRICFLSSFSVDDFQSTPKNSLKELLQKCIDDGMEIHIFEEYKHYITELFYYSKMLYVKDGRWNEDDKEHENNIKKLISSKIHSSNIEI